jgi:hypothetical protein
VTISISTVTTPVDGAVDYYDTSVRFGAVDNAKNPTGFLIHRKYSLSEAGAVLEWRLKNSVSNAVLQDWADVPQPAIIANPENIAGREKEIWVRRFVPDMAARDIDFDVRIKSNPSSQVAGDKKWQPAIVVIFTNSQSNAAGMTSALFPPQSTNQTSRYHNPLNNYLLKVSESYVGTAVGSLAESIDTTKNIPVMLVNRGVANQTIESWLPGGSGVGATSQNWKYNIEEWLRWGKWNLVGINIGEANSTLASTWGNFKANLRSSVEALRNLIGATADDLPAFVNVTGGIQNGDAEGLNAIRQAQLESHDPTFKMFVSQSAVGFELADEGAADIHYTPEHYNRLGKLYAASMNEFIGGRTPVGELGQSDPAIISVARVGQVLTFTIQHDLGTDITVPANAGLALKIRLAESSKAPVNAQIEKVSATAFSVTLPDGTGQVEWRYVEGTAFDLTGNTGLIVDNSSIGARPLMPSAGWLPEAWTAP